MATISRRQRALRRRPGAATALREVARLHVRAQRVALAADGTSTTHCTILTELGRTPAMPMATLARRLRVDKGWISRAVDQMLRAGLVEKVTGSSDRRTVTLSLTRTGRARHRRLESLLDAQVARIIGRVGKGDRATVGRVLQLLHVAYLEELALVSPAAATKDDG